MINKFSITLLILFLCSFQSGSFKDNQLRYPRVRQAYNEKEDNMLALLQKGNIDRNKLKIYLRAFKREKQIELWGKNDTDEKYTFIKTYKICKISGKPGPKRKQGDLQIPEGYYHISEFNPNSKFHLSLGINYPNRSDEILANKDNPGDDIFIHGNCVTLGCLPITDDKIKELYIFCVEAKNNGKANIPVTIFPSRLSDKELNRLILKHKSDSDKIGLWMDLKKGYDIFNETKNLPSISFLNSGRHNVRQ